MKQADEVLGAKIVGGLREASTPWAGASLLVELFRRSGIEAVANRVLPAKGSAKGLKQGQTVESFRERSGELLTIISRFRASSGEIKAKYPIYYILPIRWERKFSARTY